MIPEPLSKGCAAASCFCGCLAIKGTYQKKQIKSAVEWLKKEIDNKRPDIAPESLDMRMAVHRNWVKKKIDKAFEDVI